MIKIQLYRKLRKHRPPFERRLILCKSIQNIRRCGSGIDSSQLRASCLGTTGKFLDDIGGNRLVVNQVFLFGEDPIPTDRLVKPKQLLVVCVRRVADLDPRGALIKVVCYPCRPISRYNGRLVAPNSKTRLAKPCVQAQVLSEVIRGQEARSSGATRKDLKGVQPPHVTQAVEPLHICFMHIPGSEQL